MPPHPLTNFEILTFEIINTFEIIIKIKLDLMVFILEIIYPK